MRSKGDQAFRLATASSSQNIKTLSKSIKKLTDSHGYFAVADQNVQSTIGPHFKKTILGGTLVFHQVFFF